MKKLMFILAAVAMAASVQAASVSWTCTNVYAGNDSDKVSGVAYFLTTDMLAYSDAQALAGKGKTAITTALGSAYSFNGSAGTFSVSSPGVANATLGLSDGADYTAYLMIFDSATITDESKFYLTATKGLTTYTGADDTTSVKWQSQATASKQASGWASATGGVPEPTSGLLLLIGGAMLALRRKQK